MHKIVIIFFCFFCVIGELICGQQTIENLIIAGSTANDNGSKITYDSDGNIYVTGDFRGTVDFDPTAGVSNRTSNGSSDVFFAKYFADGTLAWVQSIGGINGEISTDLMLDPNGDIILVGPFNNTVDFDPTAGTLLKAASNDGGYIAKYDDADGTLIWVSTIGSSQYDRLNAVDLDEDGNIYITGYMGGNADFDPGVGSFIIASGGGRDTYVAKYNNDGELVWANMMGGTGQEEGKDIKLDSEGNVYITGTYLEDFDIDPGVGTTTLTHNTASDVYLAKFDNSGNFIWARTISDAGSVTVAALDFDDNDNIYLTGEFYNTVDFDPAVAVNNITSSGNSDIYLLKLDDSGDFDWVNTFGNAGNDIPSDLFFDGNSSIYIAGQFSGTVDFDPSGDVNQLSSNGGTDGLIARYSLEGDYQDAFSFGNAGNENTKAIVVDENRQIYATGSFVFTVDFNPEAGTTNAASNGGFDFFAVVYSQILEPVVTTENVNDITANSARSGGRVLDNGNSTITNTGVVWSTDPNPTLSSYSGGGFTRENSQTTFTSIVTDLVENTRYYLRAYATNSIGTGYGNQIIFETRISIENDGNQDGILDINQNNVATILSADGVSFITIESEIGTTLSEVGLYEPLETEYFYPFGMVEFKLNATVAEVDLIFHGANYASNYNYRKIDSDFSYDNYGSIEWSTRSLNGELVRVARLSLTDGGEGDFDGVVNGEIYDPGGLAVPISNIPVWDWWWVVLLILAIYLSYNYFQLQK